MQKPLLIHVIDSLITGGAEILLKNSVNQLSEYRHLVIYLFPDDTQQSAFEGDVSFVCLNHSGWGSTLKTVRRLRSIIRRERPLLVHSHLFVSNLMARLATPAKVRLYNSLHSTYSIDAFGVNKKSVWAERLTLKKRHRLVAVSDYVLNDYLLYVPFRGKTFVLYNFLPDYFYESDKQPSTKEPSIQIRCVALGSLKEAKNYPYLFKMFAAIRDTAVSLDVYGEGPLQKPLEQWIDRERLPVTLHGNVDITPELLQQYDLFVQSSSHEGFGLSLIEAMAAKIPTLVSDLPVFREVSGGFSHFFPLNNIPVAAAILKKICGDGEMRSRFVVQAYQYCTKHYSPQAYKQSLLAIYQQ